MRKGSACLRSFCKRRDEQEKAKAKAAGGDDAERLGERLELWHLARPSLSLLCPCSPVCTAAVMTSPVAQRRRGDKERDSQREMRMCRPLPAVS